MKTLKEILKETLFAFSMWSMFFIVATCGGEEKDQDPVSNNPTAPEGTLGGKCFSDNTCNAGLICRSPYCISENDIVGDSYDDDNAEDDDDNGDDNISDDSDDDTADDDTVPPDDDTTQDDDATDDDSVKPDDDITPPDDDTASDDTTGVDDDTTPPDDDDDISPPDDDTTPPDDDTTPPDDDTTPQTDDDTTGNNCPAGEECLPYQNFVPGPFPEYENEYACFFNQEMPENLEKCAESTCPSGFLPGMNTPALGECVCFQECEKPPPCNEKCKANETCVGDTPPDWHCVCDCPSGSICEGEACIKICEPECQDGLKCINGECVEKNCDPPCAADEKCIQEFPAGGGRPYYCVPKTYQCQNYCAPSTAPCCRADLAGCMDAMFCE